MMGELEPQFSLEHEVVLESHAIMLETNPELNPAVVKMTEEVTKLKKYATDLTVTGPDDVKRAADDLGMLLALDKTLKEKKEEYFRPFKEQADAVSAVFKPMLEAVAEATAIYKAKVIAYNNAIEAERLKMEKLNQDAIDLARRQSEATGEFTVDITPVPVPAAPPKTVRAQAANLTQTLVPEFEVVDFKELPDDYKLVDSGKLYRIIKAANGAITIPGVKITMKPGLTTRQTK
jgi:hypothetical protein